MNGIFYTLFEWKFEKNVEKIEINFGSSKIISTFATRLKKAEQIDKFIEKTDKDKYKQVPREFKKNLIESVNSF